MSTDVSGERITSIFRTESQPSHMLHAGSLLGWFSMLKIRMVSSSETSVDLRTTRRYIPRDGNIHHYRYGNLKSYIRIKQTNKLHGLCPRANYTDRATAACRRSDCQLLRIKGATWSASRIPPVVFSVF
jgi:hypothetical protein